ncbi:Hsp70 family protein [Treponema sp.]|uniref:LysM peptidoglycan-binding domain-containing protein n=1 Tax=Treponema sp. TaxID=166 RepID=UPI003F0F6AD6
MKSIGIKLADGTFYPLLEEGNPEKKTIDLTTVMDNQTKVQVDVYRTETGSLEGAEYVDTLEIENLNPHQNGEPTLCLAIDVDENNELSAEIRDLETGKKSEIQVKLASRTHLDEADSDIPVTISDEDLANAGLEDFVSAQAKKSADDDFHFDDLNSPSAEKTQEEEPDADKEIFGEDSLKLPEFAAEENTEQASDDFSAFETDVPEQMPETDAEIQPEISDTQPDEITGLPDFDETESVADTDDLNFDTASLSVEENETPSFDDTDFEIPDFDSTETESLSSDEDFSFPEDSTPEIDEQPKDPTFQPNTSMFSNLYDKETMDGTLSSYSEEDEIKRKTKAPVIICVVCAIICVIAALLVLFVIPSRLNILASQHAENELQEQEFPVDEEPVSQEPPVEIFPEPLPAKEDEIVVAETPAAVIPEPPAPSPEPVKDIRYKIVWGDTLWDISTAYYKTPWKYKRIADYNGIRNPDRIISGKWILIPSE